MVGLGRSAAKGAAVTMLGQALRIVMQFVTLIVIARLLTPSEIGVVAMVTAVVGVSELVRDLGLSNASIQAKVLTNAQRNNLFWISSGIGILIGGAVVLTAPLIASLYGSPDLRAIAMVLSLTFVFNGFAAQHKASLARGLRFRALALVETLPPISAGVLAIVLAASGWSYWALVGQQVFQALLALVVVILAARWVPGLPKRADGMRPLVAYGANLLGAQLVAYFSRNIDTIVSGVRFGAGPTGLYSRAFDLVIRPLTQVSAPSTRVAMPILSRLQDDSPRFDAFLLRGQKIMLVVLVPVLGAAIAVAEPLVLSVLGEQWAELVPIFQVLAGAAVIRVCGYPTYWAALSRGATKVSLYVNLVSAPVFVVAIIAGSMISVVGIAVGFAFGTVATWVISLFWYRRAVDLPSWRLFTEAVRSFLGVLPATVLTWSVVTYLIPSSGIVALGTGIGLFLVVYVLTVAVSPSLRRDYLTALDTIRLIKKRRP